MSRTGTRSSTSASGGGGILGTIGNFVGGPLGGLAAGALGGIFGMHSAKDRNRAQMEMAQAQMDFQERMSNTAYQRAAKDLEAAGLNRILALGKPASSPAGAMAQIEDIGPKTINSALSVRRQHQEIQNMRAQEHNVLADTQNKGLQHLIMTHGEEVASVAADVFRTVRHLMGNKSPEQMAALISAEIEKLRGKLTDVMSAATPQGRQASWESIKKAITQYINFGLNVSPAGLIKSGIGHTLQQRRESGEAYKPGRGQYTPSFDNQGQL